MSSDDYFNLSNLHGPVGDKFTKALTEAPTTLTPQQAPEFYNVTLNHFADDVDTSTGLLILSTIRKLLADSSFLDVFTINDLLLLPYSQPQYHDSIYLIVNDLVQSNPNLLDKTFVDDNHFSLCVQTNPAKALYIISKIAQKYFDDDEFEAWPILDLLVYKHRLFKGPDVFPGYAQLIIYLIQKNQEYLESRAANHWKNLVDLLNYVEDPRPVYIALNYVRDALKKTQNSTTLKFPVNKIINDLKNKDLQSPILSLLVDRADTNPLTLNDPELIQALFNVAEENNSLKATIVLMKLSVNEKIAKQILGDGYWLTRPLPEPVDTLRLFLAIFQHQNLREEISHLDIFITFLKYIVEELGTAGVITIVTTIVRRIPLDKDMVENMAKEGFVKAFIDTAINTNDESKVSTHSLLLFLNTIAEYAYLNEYLGLVPKVVDITINDKNLCEIASYVATTLAKYEPCVHKMLELKLDEFFLQHKNDKTYKRIAKNGAKFAKAIESYK